MHWTAAFHSCPISDVTGSPPVMCIVGAEIALEYDTMKKSIALVFVASTLLLAGCCTMPHATKWEYKVEDATHWTIRGAGPQAWQAGYQSHLNDLGKDGWVLVTEQDGRIFYFKRPLK
jgi:hypothetical protein